MFENLNIARLERDANNLITIESSSYLKSYQHFLDYFENITGDIEERHLVISSHFVYGWMPTIIRLSFNNIIAVCNILNEVKSGEIIDENQLELVRQAVNNSVVGTSKLLHFIAPKVYPIWDSRVYRYIMSKPNYSKTNNVEYYLKYQDLVLQMAKDKRAHVLQRAISSKINYDVSTIRALELIMFETDKKEQDKIKKLKRT